MKYLGALVLSFCTFACSTHSSANRAQASLEFESIRTEYEIPALVVGKTGPEGDSIEAFGVRRIDKDAPALSTDKWHLGSNGKSMTATLVAIMVEKGVLSFSTKLSEVYDKVHSDFKDVTVKDLLAHRAGVLSLQSSTETEKLWGILTDKDLTVAEQRDSAAKFILTMPADHSKDKYQYSNMGYVLVGDMLHKLTGKTWEELMAEELFGPLSMDSCGFGAPGSGSDVPEHPWPHIEYEEVLYPIPPKTEHSDNPASLGPAGTIHCSMQDWVKFMNFHISGYIGKDSKILSAESFKILHSDSYKQSYTPGGFVYDNSGSGGLRLGHNGSNRMNYALFVMDMGRGEAFFAVANRAGKGVGGVKKSVEMLGAPKLCLGEACLVE